MKVEHWDTEQDGPLTEAALKRKLQARGFHVTRYVYSPGTYFPDHTHGVNKIDAVLAGRFRMTTPEGPSCSKPATVWMFQEAPCTARKWWAISRW